MSENVPAPIQIHAFFLNFLLLRLVLFPHAVTTTNTDNLYTARQSVRQSARQANKQTSARKAANSSPANSTRTGFVTVIKIGGTEVRSLNARALGSDDVSVKMTRHLHQKQQQHHHYACMYVSLYNIMK